MGTGKLDLRFSPPGRGFPAETSPSPFPEGELRAGSEYLGSCHDSIPWLSLVLSQFESPQIFTKDRRLRGGLVAGGGEAGGLSNLKGS